MLCGGAGERNALDTPYRDDAVELPVSLRVTFSSNGMLRRPEVDSIGLEGTVSLLGKGGRHSAHGVLHGRETHQLNKHRQVFRDPMFRMTCLSVSAHPSVHLSLSASPATHFARA